VGAVVLGSEEADHHPDQEDTDAGDTAEDGLLRGVVRADREALFAADAVLLVRGQLRQAEERGEIRLLALEALLEGGVRGVHQPAAAHLHPKNEPLSKLRDGQLIHLKKNRTGGVARERVC